MGWRRWVGIGTVVGLIAVACSKSESTPTDDGSGGEGGEASQSQSGAGQAGASQSAAGQAGAAEMTCEPWMPQGCPPNARLEDCAPTLDSVPLAQLCIYAEVIERYATDCGGTLIEANFGTHGDTWMFDEAGNLIDQYGWIDIVANGGAGSDSDPTCPNPCQRTGLPEVLCDGEVGGAGTGGAGYGGAGGEGTIGGAGGA